MTDQTKTPLLTREQVIDEAYGRYTIPGSVAAFINGARWAESAVREALAAKDGLDSYDAIWDALQRIDTAAVMLPTFEVRQEGGIEAVAQNIVDAICAATSALSAQPTAAQPAPAGLTDVLRELVSAHDDLQRRDFSGGPADYEQQRDRLRAAWAAARAALTKQEGSAK